MEISDSPHGRNTSALPDNGAGLLNSKEAASYISLSPRSLLTLTQAGRLRSVRFSMKPGSKVCRVRYRRCDLDEYIQSCVVEPLTRSRTS